MGIDKHGLLLIEYAAKKNANFDKVCTIGRQQIQIKKSYYKKILNITGNINRLQKLNKIDGEIYMDFYENKHINSDLLSVNFTNLTNDEFHKLLYEANKTLIENYYSTKLQRTLANAEKLYLEQDASFRGFRQT